LAIWVRRSYNVVQLGVNSGCVCLQLSFDNFEASSNLYSPWSSHWERQVVDMITQRDE
jgi:hypothetical protein